MSELDIPVVKTVRGIPSFKGFLRLGDSDKYSTAIRIPVERYYRTYVARPPQASTYVLRSDAGGDGAESSTAAATEKQQHESEDRSSLTNVRNLRTYQVQDETAPGGKIDVDRENLAKGYAYGRTAVPISETDENITKLETFASLDFVGFVESQKVCCRHFICCH